MNSFDERYEIRLGTLEDIPAIQAFINEHWKKGHIMATDRTLFDYEFVEDNQVNMILAIDRNTNQIEGIFGFLRCSHTKDPSKQDIWGSMWKVNEQHDNLPLLGIELAKHVYPLTGCRMQIGNGANPKTTIPLRKLFFREKTCRMKQYYMLNHEMDSYNVAIINHKDDKPIFNEDKDTALIAIHSMKELNSLFDMEIDDALPYKDQWYVNHRFFEHPYYKYQCYGIQQNNTVTAIFFLRTITVNNGTVARIVDYIGNPEAIEQTGALLYDLMVQNQWEYIDFYEFGLPDQYLENAKFRYRNDADKNVIPNYFEPFVQENVDIWCHYKSEGTTFFKADGDQDRPNSKPTERGIHG